MDAYEFTVFSSPDINFNKIAAEIYCFLIGGK